MMYSSRVLEEFYNPEHYGVIKGAHAVGKVVSDIGSEILKIFITVEGDKVAAAEFQAFGGVVAIACTSVANNLMIGKKLADIKKLNVNNILEVLGEIPENKMYLAQALLLKTIKTKINLYKRKLLKAFFFCVLIFMLDYVIITIGD